MLLREVRPWHAIIGLAFGGVGAVFMGGAFAVALAGGALATVPLNDGSVPILQAIMDFRGALFLVYLSALQPIATLVVGAGLYTSRVVPDDEVGSAFDGLAALNRRRGVFRCR